MTTLYLTRGLPGAGKSTWMREQVAAAEPGSVVNVNRDLIGAMLHGQRPHLPKTEAQITTAHHAMVESNLRYGTDVIVDDTNLKLANLRKLCEIGWRCNADVQVVDFDVPVDVCVARDAERPRPVGEDVVRGLARRYLSKSQGFSPAPVLPEVPRGMPYVPDTMRPQAIMIDIDGTVALRGSRDPYDTSRYSEDTPNGPVVAAVRALVADGYQPVFCSGRGEEFRDVTESWVRQHVTPDFELHARPMGDRRRDDVIKLELFDKHIRTRWQVLGVFDDRRRVYEMWRSIGLTVFAVAEGDF